MIKHSSIAALMLVASTSAYAEEDAPCVMLNSAVYPNSTLDEVSSLVETITKQASENKKDQAAYCFNVATDSSVSDGKDKFDQCMKSDSWQVGVEAGIGFRCYHFSDAKPVPKP